MEETAASRKKRKEEGRRLKRQRIEGAGGVRPREHKTEADSQQNEQSSKPSPTFKPSKQRPNNKGRQHHFGRVMEQVPSRNKPRFSTLSIAVPGSVVSNCQTRELRTQVVGQIARAATIYHIDEVIVFDDKLAKDHKKYNRGFDGNRHRHDNRSKEATGTVKDEESTPPLERQSVSDPHNFMARVLQYCECPQYLRRNFFPMHPDLQFAGLLAPIDAPHHVRAEDRCRYREGVVLDKTGSGPEAGSLVNCGIRGRPVEIDARLTSGIRCTVQLESSAYNRGSIAKGKVVSPSAPREDNGTYWGYTTRLASSIKAVLDECPFGEYDLKIGTSERGDENVESNTFALPRYQHALIVFGGPNGIEECVDADETLKLPGSQSKKLFDLWVNICPYQGSRTIRSEEAVLIGLAKFSPFLVASSADTKSSKEAKATTTKNEAPQVEFSDEGPSEESSESSDDNDSE